MAASDPVNGVMRAASGMGSAAASLVSPRGPRLRADQTTDARARTTCELDGEIATATRDAISKANELGEQAIVAHEARQGFPWSCRGAPINGMGPDPTNTS
jgi:hypothetical protein